MEFKITKYSTKIKEELPPISRPVRSASCQIIKNHKENSSKPTEITNKIDPLVLVTQHEREINKLKVNHNQMLEELHKELEVLRSKNRDLLDELIIMNGGNYCCKHLQNLSHEILKSNASDNQKQLSDIMYNAKIQQISIENNKNYVNNNHKKELPELIAVGNKFISKNDTENKSNLLLQDQLNKCNKLIDVLQKENIQQKKELNSLNSLLRNGLKISGVGLDSGLIRKNLKSSKKLMSSVSHPTISFRDIITSEESLQSVSGSE